MGQDGRRPANYGMFNPQGRPLNLYHVEDRNHCPNCAGVQWYIGRVTAECANCGTALSLSAISGQTQQPMFFSTKSATAEN